MILLAILVISGTLGALLAYRQGRNIFLWGILCGIIPFLLIALFALPRKPELTKERPCPYCLSMIRWKAQSCKFCKSKVPPAGYTSCNYCDKLVWAGMEKCPSCSKPAPWNDDDE